MRLLQKMCFVVLASGLALGQATAPNSGSAGSGSVADELKALREAISQQQQQIAQQQQQLQTLQQKLDEKNSAKQPPQQDASASSSTGTSSSNATRMAAGTPHVANASLNTTPVSATVVQETEKKESPLSFRIGGTEFTPGGFIDFENVFRTTNTGQNIATSFGTIPFINNGAGTGQLSEFRSTAQYSRFNLKIAGKYGENKILGYIEGDFNGNDANNVFFTSNPHTTRVRLAWADFRRGNWEVLAGQTWGLQTPNRVGLSPMPSDVFAPIGEDAQTHVGLPYTRAAEFRVTYHFNDNFQWAVAVQNPDQFQGAGIIVFPAAFPAAPQAQLDSGAAISAPNFFPDIHTKMAWDTDMSGRHMHFELGGIVTSAKIANQILTQGVTTPASAPFFKHSAIGGGGEGAFNVELVKGFRIVANGIYGDGIGRYLIGLAPQTVVVPIQTGPTTFDTDLSFVHSGGAIVGAEATVHKNTQFGFYYGGFYAARNAFSDLSAANTTTPAVSCAPGEPALQKPCAGFGATNSANSQNRAIQEGSFDWTQTLWRNPQYGALQLVTQTSYVTRAPWFVATTPGTPKNAHLMMGYVSLKYVIP